MTDLTLELVDGWVAEIGRHPQISAWWRSMLTWCDGSTLSKCDGEPIGGADRQLLRTALAARLATELAHLPHEGAGELRGGLELRVAQLRSSGDAPAPAPSRLGGIFANAANTSLRMGDMSRGYSTHVVLKCP